MTLIQHAENQKNIYTKKKDKIFNKKMRNTITEAEKEKENNNKFIIYIDVYNMGKK
jgi:hypothetical protein